MSSVVAPPRLEVGDKTLSLNVPLWAIVALAVIAAQALMTSHISSVLSTGAFFDSDDAMRAVQVRDLLAGQSWFDMTAYRLDPPVGVFSHWSRVVDTPLALLELFFRNFLSIENAELATRFVFPLLLLTALFALSPWFARALDANANQPLAVLLALLSGAIYMQFLPGRIDHHAPQIVLLMLGLAAFLRGLSPAGARWMALASFAMALSMAISLENLPFFAAIVAALPVLFLLGGVEMRAPLAWFGLSGLVAFPATMALTVAPSRYFLPACDAYSTPHIAAILVGLVELSALALFAPALNSLRRRAAAVTIVVASAGATFVFVAPQCVGDPLGGVDPLVRDLWLSHVTEALPLWKSWAKAPNTVIATLAPNLLGLGAALAWAARSKDLARWRWLIVSGVIAMGIAIGAFWQVRVFTSSTPIAMIPLLGVAAGLVRRFGANFMPLTRGLMAAVFCAFMTPVGLAAFLPDAQGETRQPAKAASSHVAPNEFASGSAEKNEHACMSPEALRPLAKLAPQRIVASFDFGPYILAYTPHSAFAGPYHRDNRGNRFVIDAFEANPDSAEQLMRHNGAGLVLWCKYEAAGFVKKAPEGLAAKLAAGQAPSWLEQLPVSTENLLVFAIRTKN